MLDKKYSIKIYEIRNTSLIFTSNQIHDGNAKILTF